MKNRGNILKITSVIILMVMCFTSGLIAQSKKIAFEKYGIAEGLPEEFVTSMVQDDQGFMWFATQNGLVKFDGYNMKVYKASRHRNDSTQLQIRSFNSLIKAKDGKLWFSSYGDGSYSSFNPITEKFRTYQLSSQNNTNNSSNVMFEDNASNIWLVNTNSKVGSTEITRLNTKTHESKSYPHQVSTWKINDIYSNGQMLFVEADNSIWITDNTGNLKVYNSQEDTFNTIISAGSEIPGTQVSDTIRKIFKGNKNQFLLLGENSLSIWDPIKKSSIRNYTNDKNLDNTFSGNKTGFWVFEDAVGQYWVSYENGIILRINPETKENTPFIYGQGAFKFENALKNPEGSLPLFQNDKGIWFGVANSSKVGLIYYDHIKKSFHYYNEQFNDDKNTIQLFRPYAPFIQLMEDKTGYLWIGTRPNFYKESPKTRQIELFNHKPKDSFSIPSDTIYGIYEDSKQRLWISTKRGLTQKTENNTFQQFYFRNSSEATTLGNVTKVYEDSQRQIWASTNGNGLLYLDEDTQEFIKCPENVGQNIWAIQEDKQGNIWVSSYYGGVKIINSKSKKILKTFSAENKDKHGLLSPRISDLFLDSKGYMWLGDSDDNDLGVFKYLESKENFKHYKKIDNDSLTLNSNEIRNFIEDDRGRMWVNTDGGVNLYNDENDVFYPSKTSVDMASTKTLIKGTNGKVWVATYASGGLALVGPGVNDMNMFGEDKGLLHNDITNLVFDDFGKLWLPTKRGLSVFDTLTKTYSSYFKKDGFQENSGGNNPMLKTKNGDIWIGGNNGLNRVIPSQLSKKELSVPTVLITSMNIMDSIYSKPDGKIFKKAVSYTDKIELKHWQKNMRFDFVGLHYLRPEDNQYSWILENYDTNWSAPSKERTTSYTNLSPGTYNFRVKASNADGVWNEEGASLEIVILPPWWQTWWAFSLYAAILVFIVYRLYLIQKQKTIEKERQRNQQKQIEQAKEIEKAYNDLKATQQQLIQSEKMASLGELTAGIAHEIQNPLNFVNNFSEVSNELIDEIKESRAKSQETRPKTEDDEIEDEILEDIKQNLEKINHHGKRADSIVKGMLQHSRASGNKKAPTDINALADEYMRLAYHGLRAKDKSFNAELVTNFDETIEKINVVPQDIGRVILNILTNAFYVVNERKKTEGKDYKPTVKISTKRHKKSIEISVEDNGKGMPDHVKDKIFQPFFTTKPTGQGTGLGLSMSYDIITKGHNGAFEVESIEGQSTTFRIILPLNKSNS